MLFRAFGGREFCSFSGLQFVWICPFCLIQSVPRQSCLGTAQPGVPAWLSPWPEQCLHCVLHPEQSKLPQKWDGTCWRQLWLGRLYLRTPGQQVMFSKLSCSLCMQGMRSSSLLSHCKSQELFSLTLTCLNSLRNSSITMEQGRLGKEPPNKDFSPGNHFSPAPGTELLYLTLLTAKRRSFSVPLMPSTHFTCSIFNATLQKLCKHQPNVSQLKLCLTDFKQMLDYV